MAEAGFRDRGYRTRVPGCRSSGSRLSGKRFQLFRSSQLMNLSQKNFVTSDPDFSKVSALNSRLRKVYEYMCRDRLFLNSSAVRKKGDVQLEKLQTRSSNFCRNTGLYLLPDVCVSGSIPLPWSYQQTLRFHLNNVPAFLFRFCKSTFPSHAFLHSNVGREWCGG